MIHHFSHSLPPGQTCPVSSPPQVNSNIHFSLLTPRLPRKENRAYALRGAKQIYVLSFSSALAEDQQFVAFIPTSGLSSIFHNSSFKTALVSCYTLEDSKPCLQIHRKKKERKKEDDNSIITLRAY